MSDAVLDLDVLVIRSAFGGATAAARLTAGGMRVTLIERGPGRDTVPVGAGCGVR